MKKYEKAEMTLVALLIEDVIATSAEREDYPIVYSNGAIDAELDRV